LSAYLGAGGVRAREFPAQARRLAGDLRVSAEGAPSALSCLTECAHAYTRLMQWALEEPNASWPLTARQLQKSALDLLRYGAQAETPEAPAPSRAEFARSLSGDWSERLASLSPRRRPDRDAAVEICAELVAASLRRFDGSARRFLASAGGGPAASAPAAAGTEPSFIAAEKRARLGLLDEQRAAFDDAVVGAVVDDVYRSRLVLDDEYVAGPMLRESLAARLRSRRLEPRRATLPLLLTPALQKLFGWLPYLDCPLAFLETEEFRAAGCLVPGAYQLRWGRLDAAAPPPDILAAATREAAGNHAMTWRLMGWRDAAPASGPLAHFLLSRRLGLRLLLERGVAASFFDLDALIGVYSREFPKESIRLAGLPTWNADSDPTATFFALYPFLDGIDIAGQSRYSAREGR
jgi:hypothetical protein